MVNINYLMEIRQVVSKQMLEALAAPLLRQCFFLFLTTGDPPSHQEPAQSVTILLRHPIVSPFSMEALYPPHYPDAGITFSILNEDRGNSSWIGVQSLILACAQKYRHEPLREILQNIGELLNSLWQSHNAFEESRYAQRLPPLKLARNGNSSYSLVDPQSYSPTPRIIEALRLKIRQILSELQQSTQSGVWKELEECLINEKAAPKGVQRILLNSELKEELQSQANSGQLLTRFMRGSNGPIAKKFIIEHYAHILQIIDNPQLLEQCKEDQSERDYSEGKCEEA